MKRFAIILLALGTLIFAGIASAQRGGGGGHGGGSMGGGSMGGGSTGGGMHSGSWSGGSHGGSWGGSHGGSWSGGWRGGSSGWHGGSWHGGWHGSGWRGSTVVVGVGGPWWGWWPGYYPYYGGYYGGNYGYPASYPYPYYGYGEYAPMYDTGTYVQRPDASYPSDQQYQGQYQGQGGQVTSDGYSYYCPNPGGYYPQIPSCAAGWLRVVPQGAPGPTAPGQR